MSYSSESEIFENSPLLALQSIALLRSITELIRLHDSALANLSKAGCSEMSKTLSMSNQFVTILEAYRTTYPSPISKAKSERYTDALLEERYPWLSPTGSRKKKSKGSSRRTKKVAEKDLPPPWMES